MTSILRQRKKLMSRWRKVVRQSAKRCSDQHNLLMQRVLFRNSIPVCFKPLMSWKFSIVPGDGRWILHMPNKPLMSWKEFWKFEDEEITDA